MKKIIAITTTLALGTLSSFAGGDYSSSLSSTSAPVAAAGLGSLGGDSCGTSGWFLGGGAGYLFDTEEAYYTLQFGKEFGQHSVYLEGLFVENETESTRLNGLVNLTDEFEIIPITLNYKYEDQLTDSLNWYVGAGAGWAFVDNTYKVSVPSAPGFNSNSSGDDVVFSGQLFGGITYDVTCNLELFLGVRYIWIDDADLGSAEYGAFGDTIDANSVSAGENGDFGVDLGLRYNF